MTDKEGQHPPTPAVSVVMPAVEVDNEFMATLASLENQRFDKSWELVVSLNSQSSSVHKQLIQVLADSDLADTKIVVADSGKGAAYTRNAGASEVSSEIIAFIDSDDLAHPDWLAELYNAVVSSPEMACSGYLDETKLGIAGQGKWRPQATPGELPTFMGAKYLLSGNMALHAKQFEKVGGFDTSLTRCEDIAFGWQLQNNGVELRYVPQAIVYYRHRKGLWKFLQQHFMYGRGFSEVISKYENPSQQGSQGDNFFKKLKPNGQQVEHLSIFHYARRGAIALGRVYGLLQQRREGK